MDPVMITCEVCGQPAVVLKARYKYEGESIDGRPANEHVLIEVQREVECPKCGIRTQAEREKEK
jgi:DNA-directed RNA polymerase subunit RPC12/RpoP